MNSLHISVFQVLESQEHKNRVVHEFSHLDYRKAKGAERPTSKEIQVDTYIRQHRDRVEFSAPTSHPHFSDILNYFADSKMRNGKTRFRNRRHTRETNETKGKSGNIRFLKNNEKSKQPKIPHIYMALCRLFSYPDTKG